MDLLFLDRSGIVLAVRRDVRPWRLAFGPRKTHAIVETLPGSADVQPGEVLRLQAIEQPAKPPKAVEFLLD
jgi:hypothetical protein